MKARKATYHIISALSLYSVLCCVNIAGAVKLLKFIKNKNTIINYTINC